MMKAQLRSGLRKAYYYFNHNRIVGMQGYAHLKGSKWVSHSKYGMAYYKGYYEPELCAFLQRNLQADSVFIDAGAHAGYFSLFAARLCTQGVIHSFEPDQENYQYLTRIKQLNSIENWKTYPYAVGNVKTTLGFAKGETSTTGSVQETGDIQVEAVTIDEVFSDAARVDVMKIDVEGFGGRVLEGAVKTIERCKPIILFEEHAGSDESIVLHQLLSNSYEFTDMETGETLTSQKDVHFVVAKPKKII